MIKVKRPSDQKEYNRICKEWDSINEPESSGSKYHWKGILCFVLVIGAFGGLFYALSKVRKSNQGINESQFNPFLGGYEDEVVYNEGEEPYSVTMDSNVGNHVYDYDSTYNGLEMSGFVSTIYHLLDQNVEYINEYNSSLSEVSNGEETLTAWTEMLDTYEQSLNDQVHHSSFEPAYKETMDFIEYNRELIENPEDLHGEKLIKLDEKTTSIMDRICEGFDKNSIRYTKGENGEIKFWYEKN